MLSPDELAPVVPEPAEPAASSAPAKPSPFAAALTRMVASNPVQAAAEAAAKAAAEQAAAAAEAAEAEKAEEAEESAPAASSGSASASGSYQEYALAQLGGNASEFSCLESLWGKESGWNPNAQNPTSTAYGIPQFLDSTWKGTGIAKTSDPYRQIDAGLIYIDSRYGSPCGAWAHSKSTGWY
ncbi:lytic transglycosylase domain-containing protein [Modestobacter versicolor]|uniref:Lytic transglycosylase domain-containing protein n=2 Tax=Modestobacter versicolor TaxID=429133 RepID=A0A323VFE4_9ACTN|nr:lytic transglycosylase domain-containing protein [Modestobacter versicolor]